MTEGSQRLFLQCAAIATVVIGGAVSASAQQPDAFPAGYPRWDVSGGLGIHYLDRREFDGGDSWWDVKALPRVQVGRYLTQHLKAEVSVAGPTTYDLYEYEPFPVSGLPAGGWAVTYRTVKVATISPAATYQFFENAFVHPFIAGGVDVNIGDDHRERSASTTVVNRVSYQVPAIDTRRTLAYVRPFFAVGSKSYFNDWTFIRPEAHIALSLDGASQVSLRLDVGVDF